MTQPQPQLVRRAFVAALVTLAGVAFFPVVSAIPWAWARECGDPSALHAIAFLAPGLACIFALDYWILTGRLTIWRAVGTVAATTAAAWLLGLGFFRTQWGC